MRLAEALTLVHRRDSARTEELRLFLACGFTPLHLQTFLTAHLLRRMPLHRVVVETGLYGDLPGNLERIDTQRLVAVAVVVEWADLDPRLGFRTSHGIRLSELADVLNTASQRLEGLRAKIKALGERVSVAVALPTLPLAPWFRPATACGDSVALSLRGRVCDFASALAEEPMVRVLDPQRLDHLSPPGERLDLEMEFRSGFPYRREHASALAGALAALVRPVGPKKAVITDLDNTLWRGILGEDGVDALSWSLDAHGQAHALYQAMLNSLADLGVLVGVASKNDPALARQALRRSDLIVAADAIYPVEAHWGPKSESVARILRAWNIGPESAVLVDDSPMELAEVAAAFPEIETVLFPSENDHAVFGFLARLRDLCGKAAVTAEDRLRTSSLRDSGRRDRDAALITPDDFLARAEAELTFSFQAPDGRCLELVNKTNQFNLNGRRIDEATWKAQVRDERRFLVAATYRDKYGPLGKIAVAAGRWEAERPWVDVWVMSCRAFSRRIEHHVLKLLFERLESDAIGLDFAPTDRNGPMREFLAAMTGAQPAGPALINRDDFLARCPPLFAKVHVE